MRPLALQTDRAVAELVRCLNELAARRPAFRVDPATVLEPVRAATMTLTQRDEAGAEHHDTDTVRHLRWPWQRHNRRAA